MTNKKYPIVEVIWVDIIHDHSWHTLDELEAFDQEASKVVNQVAYLYEEDEEQIILVDSYFDDLALFGTIHIIPRGVIKSLRKL